MNKLDPEIAKEFDEKFLNPDKFSSSSQFKPELQGRLYQTFKQFLADTLAKHSQKKVEEVKKPRENNRGYLVEGEPCPFCNGTGDNLKQEVLC